ncbi:hypothetical protein [Citrobacter braakii]|uniref:hypothetical protein n=1 Tax=Citrobacter braakii TaxID=57706 RepID=UPI0019034E62|nr:hypothetical protein [Citrobacter braakii]MBJ8972722.1 hypothetical protein [Citrobacter braakii]
MSEGIGFFVRIFSEEKYRDDFIKGNLYMNTIKYFREYEDIHSGNVGDKHEALSAWLQPANIRMIIKHPKGDIVIPGSEIAAPIALRRNRFDSINVFCLTVLHSHGITLDDYVSEEDFEKLKAYFTLPDDVCNLGRYAAVIPNTGLFLERVRAAAQALVDAEEAIGLVCQQVTYYDIKDSLSLEDENDAIFHKQKNYEHQREFRIAFDRGSEVAEPFTLKIGDISDIAIPVLTADINKYVKLERYQADN